MQQDKQRGFTIIELMGVLLIFSVIILGSYKIVHYLGEKNKALANADKIKIVANSMATFVANNYRTFNINILGNELVLSQKDLESSIPDFVKSSPDLKVCLFIVRDAKDALTSYLIVNHDNAFNQRSIANAIGNNGYIVQAENNTYRLAGINKSNQLLTNNNITLLNSRCGFKKSVINSVFIDISRYNEFTSPSIGATDRKLTSNDNAPSIKSQGSQLVTKSSVILDNIISEAYTYNTKHCYTSSLPVNDPAILCNQNLGANISMYSGTASWVSSTLSANQQSCTGVARARFYRTDLSYTCNGVGLPTAQSYCSGTTGWQHTVFANYTTSSSPKYIISGTAIWSPNPPTLQGNRCVSQAYARYQYPSCIYDNCTNIHHGWWCPDMNGACSGSEQQQWWTGYGGIVGSYDSSANQCSVDFDCIDSRNRKKAWIQGYRANPRMIQDANYTACNSVSVLAQPVYTQVDLGYSNCSVTKSYTSITQTNGVPEQHQYRALDLGLSTQGNNSRVQVKTAANSGVASSLTELNVSRSGMNAGFVVPETVDTTIGAACNASDLGKIVKQNITSKSLSGGQLQCMYNPTVCRGNGYCYLSMKDTSYTIKFKTIQSSYSCPNTTFVANDQVADSIVSGFVCPNMSGFSLNKQVYLRYLNPYSSLYDNSQVYQTLQTACDYRNNSNGQVTIVAVNALSKVTCSTLNKTYTVNNYQQ